LSTGLKANPDGSAAIQVGGTDVITLTSGGAATFVTSPTTVQAGTAAAPSITFSGDTNTGIYSPGADQVAIGTGGTEALRVNSSQSLLLNTTSAPAASAKMKIATSARTGAFFDLTATGGENWIIDSTNTTGSTDVLGIYANGATGLYIQDTGNVGVGTTSPGKKLDVSGDIRTSSTFIVTSNGTGSITDGANTYVGLSSSQLTLRTDTAIPIVALTNGTERARITSGGDLLVGTTTSHAKFTVQGQLAVGQTAAASNASGLYIYASNALSDNSYLSRGSAGSGTTTWYIGNQTITTSSDERLKANIAPTERNALELLQQWEIVDHTWNDPSDQCENNRNSRGVWTGVVAQQVQPITPWLVNKPLEEINEDGSINPWTMDFGYAVPLLVKAIQEQQAMIDEMKAEIAALKGAA